MSDSIQDRIADLLAKYPNLLPMQRQLIHRCIRQLDTIDKASDNQYYAELESQYEKDSENLKRALAMGDVSSYTLECFTRSRSELNAMDRLRKRLGIGQNNVKTEVCPFHLEHAPNAMPLIGNSNCPHCQTLFG